MGGKRQPKVLSPVGRRAATKNPQQTQGVSRIRPTLSHLVSHPKTFWSRENSELASIGLGEPRLLVLETKTFGRLHRNLSAASVPDAELQAA